MRKISQEEINALKNEKNIIDTFIPDNILYMCRELTPKRLYIGETEKEQKIFFEECISSLKFRHYGKRDKISGWNLLISDGKTSNLLTEEEINKNVIYFFNEENWNKEKLISFLKTKNNRFNIITEQEKEQINVYRFNLTSWQHYYVKQFVDRIRNLTFEQKMNMINKMEDFQWID